MTAETYIISAIFQLCIKDWNEIEPAHENLISN